jgi:hypothetical protein
MTWLTTQLNHEDFAIRLGPMICSTIFSYLVYCLGAKLFSQRAGFIALAMISAIPTFIFVGFVLCPEAPLAALWVLNLFLIEGMRENDESWRPIAAGVCLGFAFLAKYTAVLIIGVGLLYAVFSPSFRRWLKRPSLYFGGLLSFCLALPVIIWNYQRGWPSLRHHFTERFSFLSFPDFISNLIHVFYFQFGAYHPMIFPGLLFILVVTVRRSRNDDRFRFLLWTSVPVLLFFFIAMLGVEDSEAHWTMVGYIPLIIAASAWLDEKMNQNLSTALKYYIKLCIGFSIAVVLFIYGYTQNPRLLDFLPNYVYDGESNFISEIWGWDQVQEAAKDAAQSMGEDTVIASSHFTLCARLMAQMDDQPTVYCPSLRPSEFDFINRHTPPSNSAVLYINDDRYPETPEMLLPNRDCHYMRSLSIERLRVLQHYRFYACPAVQPSELEVDPV